MKKKSDITSVYLLFLVYSVIFTCFSYFAINVGDQQHDYAYHLARLVGLAQSIQNGDFLPNLNFVFAQGAGYASPMFYGNWQFYLPALFFMFTKYATVSYAFLIFVIIFLTTSLSYYACHKISGNQVKSAIFAFLVSLSFPWFGYGMTMAVMFVALLFYSLYKVIYLEETNPILLGVTAALLIQTHILSTIILAIYALFFILLNIKKLNVAKIISFVASAFLGLILSAGFILQYFEQVSSQTLFVSWTLRDFPFPTQALVSPSTLFNFLLNYDKPVILILLIVLIVNFKKFTLFSKQLLIISILMFVMQSNILPWDSLLRHTFLATIQDTRRLVFFVPVLILMVVIMESSKELGYKLLMLQSVFYISTSLLYYLPTSNNLSIMRNFNALAINSETNPTASWFDTSGDEYFNINFNHEASRNGSLSHFENSNNLDISNVKTAYNNLEFDATVTDATSSASVVIPRIWYKGYVVEYSKGASGNNPEIKYVKLTDKEIENNKSLAKPVDVKKAEYNGKIYLNIKTSGHVKIYYKKTMSQLLGYSIEATSWLFIIGFVVFSRKRKMMSND